MEESLIKTTCSMCLVLTECKPIQVSENFVNYICLGCQGKIIKRFFSANLLLTVLEYQVKHFANLIETGKETTTSAKEKLGYSVLDLVATCPTNETIMECYEKYKKENVVNYYTRVVEARNRDLEKRLGYNKSLEENQKRVNSNCSAKFKVEKTGIAGVKE